MSGVERHTCNECGRHWQAGQLARPGVANSAWICNQCSEGLMRRVLIMLADDEERPTPTMGEI